MTRRSRSPRARSEQVTHQVRSQIDRRLPFFDLLDDDAISRLEAQVDWIIQDIGIAFRDDPEALALWREQAGVRIDGDIVRAPADWIREICSNAPSQFTQLARNPERSVTIGNRHQVFAPIYGAPFVRDLEKGRRYGDLESFQDLVRLTYLSPALHHGGFVTCEPCDVPVSKRHLDMLFTP